MHRSHRTFIWELAKASEKLARDQKPSSKNDRSHHIFSKGAWFPRFAAATCSTQCLLLWEPSGSATARRWHQICTDTDIPALGWTRTPPRTPCCTPQRSLGQQPQELCLPRETRDPGWMPGLQSPFRELGEHPQVSTSARRAESCNGVSELPLEQLPSQVPKPSSWVRTINTPL